MVRVMNVVLVTVSLTLPIGGYVVLHNRRLERRLTLVKREDLPDTVRKAFQVPGKPQINYVEGYFADVSANKFKRGPSFASRVEDFARVFWSTKPILLEWKVLSLLDAIGLHPFETRVNPATVDQPEFTKGKTLLNGVFLVEKGLEEKNDPNELLFSYWMKKKDGPLLGGLHGLACQQIDKHTVRLWFVSHLALNSPSKEIKGEDVPVSKWNNWFGYDPKLVDPAGKPDESFGGQNFPVALWLHRFYSRLLMDFAVREITQRK